jgi:hypothetical protein
MSTNDVLPSNDSKMQRNSPFDEDLEDFNRQQRKHLDLAKTLHTTGAVQAPKVEAGTTTDKKFKKTLSLTQREDSLINRSSKPNVDEVISQIVKSRHQLMTFENEESKFMATLKMKAIRGMASV